MIESGGRYVMDSHLFREARRGEGTGRRGESIAGQTREGPSELCAPFWPVTGPLAATLWPTSRQRRRPSFRQSRYLRLKPSASQCPTLVRAGTDLFHDLRIQWRLGQCTVRRLPLAVFRTNNSRLRPQLPDIALPIRSRCACNAN
jgi:hypothetical protein